MDFFLPRGRKKYLADLPPALTNILPVDADPPRLKVLGHPGDATSMTLADDIARGLVGLLLIPRGGLGRVHVLLGR